MSSLLLNINRGISMGVSLGVSTSILYADSAGFTPQYQAIIDRAIELGYTLPSVACQNAQNTLISTLTSLGVLDKLDHLNVFANDSPDQNFALINWKDPSGALATLSGTNTYEAGYGFQTDGVASYIDTGFVPSSGVKYTLNDASRLVWVYKTPTVGNRVMGNVTDGDDRITAGAIVNNRINQGTANLAAAVTIDTVGLVSINRTSSTVVSVYNNLSLTSSTATSSARSANSIVLGASQASFSNTGFSLFAAGSQLTAENASLHAAFDTYFTDVAAMAPVALFTLEPFRTSATTFVDIPWGDETWVLGATPFAQKLDVDLPAGSAPSGGFPVFVWFHPNGSTKDVIPGDFIEVGLKTPAIAAGKAFISVEFRHPVQQVDYGAPHTDTGLAIQYIRAMATALNINPDRITIICQSRGNLALWQNVQPDMADAGSSTYQGRMSSLVNGIYALSSQIAYSTNRVVDLYINEADRASVLALYPDDARWQNTIDFVPTAQQVPNIVMHHKDPWAGAKVSGATFLAGDYEHWPDASRIIRDAYIARGNGDKIVAIDDIPFNAPLFDAILGWVDGLEAGLNSTEAWAISKARLYDAGLYYCPDVISGLYTTTAATTPAVVGDNVGAIIDGQYGIANRSLASPLGYVCGNSTASRRPVLVTIPATGKKGFSFDANDRYNITIATDGTPTFYAWNNVAETTTYISANTVTTQFGDPVMASTTMAAALCTNSTITARDLKGFRQFAQSISGVSYL